MRKTPTLLSSILLTTLAGLFASTPADAPRQFLAVADDSAGTVVDRQGTALLRPVTGERWTPARQKTVLMPGDLLKTPGRGANAVEVRLTGGGGLVLGPGCLVELKNGGELHLQRGQLEAKGPPKGAAGELVVTGPGGFRRVVAADETTIVGVADGKVEVLAAPPRWLAGYRSSTTNEWMGSLIANVDGRNVPLSVGYHSVDVVIRDQIARTTIEQSFVNNTKARLEGVFHFPLPADASISGFGMWIGNELVEADIVEKERARQIFEDIMRRKKDPGLLEWSGGNMFKARVFPIEPHSEKRIRIRYTQVLPLEGSTVRYRHGLRSELLRSRPLQKLQIHVTMQSTLPILAATSTTHEVQARRTPSAASLHFDAEQHTPERDFEARFELDRSQALTVIPHRRGDDGYFMLMLAPPGDGGAWQRELIPEGPPLDLLVLADTSASMHTRARDEQSVFIRSLLSLLGEKDRMSVLTCDAFVHAFRSEPVAVTGETVEAAMAFVDARPSMGWTDLSKMMVEARKHMRPGTVVVYVGDGIGTTGDADPVAIAARIKEQAKGHDNPFHAVTVSSTYEKVVLSTMAGLGGGSMRAATDDPSRAAFDLLSEVAQPAIKSLQVSFRGVRTARVYPETLPNLPRGSQQVVLGRFLPTSQQDGEVVASGVLDGKPVQFKAAFQLPEQEAGNSFMPRLWARQHLDALLGQGRSAAIRDEIIAFSEEFGIMTPYTSFLVLESDEDRERYGVTRRVKMRDGEQFFADGRDAANTELLRQQMQLARSWRLNLRARMLREIAGLGRDLYGWHIAVAGIERQSERAGVHGAWGLDSTVEGMETSTADQRLFDREVGASTGRARSPSGDAGPVDRAELAERKLGRNALAEDEHVEPEASPEQEMFDDFLPAEAVPLADPDVSAGLHMLQSRSRAQFHRDGLYGKDSRSAHGGGYRGPADRMPPGYLGHRRPDARITFAALGFPHLQMPWRKPSFEPASTWPAEVTDLLAGLHRRAALESIANGLQIVQRSETWHAVQKRARTWHEVRLLYGKDHWVMHQSGTSQWQNVEWLTNAERGVANLGLGLGRRRAPAPTDRRFPMSLCDHSLDDLTRIYHRYSASLHKLPGGSVELTLSDPAGGASSVVFVIDPARRVFVEQRMVQDGRVIGRSISFDFVEVAGMWWPQRREHRDARDRIIMRWSLAITTLDEEDLGRNIAGAMPNPAQLIVVDHKDPKLGVARQAQLAGKAGFAEHLRVALHHAASQQWEKMWQGWAKASAGLQNRVGAMFIEADLMVRGRRHQDLVERTEPIVRVVAGVHENSRRAVAWFGGERVCIRAARADGGGWRSRTDAPVGKTQSGRKAATPTRMGDVGKTRPFPTFRGWFLVSRLMLQQIKGKDRRVGTGQHDWSERS